MFKKLFIAVLAVTVIGAAVAAAAVRIKATPVEAAEQAAGVQQVQDQAQTETAYTGPIPAENQADPVSKPWTARGTIIGLDEFGLTLQTESSGEIYVELGPPDFWQNQSQQPRIGQEVTIAGTILDGMVHASQVDFLDGDSLSLRAESGQPLWSGGAENSQGQNGNASGDHTPDPLAQVDEWITVQGSLIAYRNGSMSISTAEGELLVFKTGQPRFFADQGVTFQVGDEVSVLGFYDGNEEFMAGEITQLSTNLRVMLRDPNGRPLWAGPGNGNGNGTGNGGGRGAGQ